MFILTRLPVISILFNWIPTTILIGLVIVSSWLLADIGTEGRSPISFFKSFFLYQIRKSKKQVLYRGRYVDKPTSHSVTGYFTVKAQKFKKGEIDLNTIAFSDFAPTKELESVQLTSLSLGRPTKEPKPIEHVNDGVDIGLEETALTVIPTNSEQTLVDTPTNDTNANTKEKGTVFTRKHKGDKSLWLYGLGIAVSILLMIYVGTTTVFNSTQNATPEEIEQNDDYDFIDVEVNENADLTDTDLTEWLDNMNENEQNSEGVVSNDNSNEVLTDGSSDSSSSGTSIGEEIVSSATDYIRPNTTNNMNTTTNYTSSTPSYNNFNNSGTSNSTSNNSTSNNEDNNTNIDEENTNANQNNVIVDETGVVNIKFDSMEDAWNYIDNNMVREYLLNKYVDWEITRLLSEIDEDSKEHRVFYKVKWLSEVKDDDKDLQALDKIDFRLKSESMTVLNDGSLYRTLMALEKDLKEHKINDMKKHDYDYWWVRKVYMEDGTYRYTVDFYKNKPNNPIGNTGETFNNRKDALSWVNNNYDTWFEKGYTLWSVYEIDDNTFTVNFEKVKSGTLETVTISD